jgi:hypothetical protein
MRRIYLPRYEYLTRTHEERKALVEKLSNSPLWELTYRIESKGNTYYEFTDRKHPNIMISINDGESDLFEDVILKKD